MEGDALRGIKALGERSKWCSFQWILHLPACSGVIHHLVLSSADGRVKEGGGLSAGLGASSAKNPSQINHMILLDFREGVTFVMANVPFTVGYFK